MALRLATVTHTIVDDGVGKHVEISTAGILEDDIVVVFFNADGDSNLNDANFTPDPGFTAPAAGLNTQSAPDGSSYRVCHKVATASEPANYDFINTAYAQMYPMMLVISGRDGTVTYGSWNTNTNGNSSVISSTYNSFTAAAGDDVLALASIDKSNFDAEWDFSDISGFTTAIETNGSAHGGGWESSMFSALLADASAGTSTPTQNITNTAGGGTAGYANLIITLPEAAVAGGSVGASSGGATISGISSAKIHGNGEADSVAVVQGLSSIQIAAVGASSSNSTNLGVSSAVVKSEGASVGTSVAVGSGSSSVNIPADGTAQGASVVSGQSSIVWHGVGDASSDSAVDGDSKATAASDGASAGTSVAVGSSSSSVQIPADGNAQGVTVIDGDASIIWGATGESVSASLSGAISAVIAQSVGTSVGAAVAAGTSGDTVVENDAVDDWPYHKIADNILNGHIPAGPDGDMFIRISRRGLRRGK